MTETIEQKALALVNEVAVDFRVPPWDSIDRRSFLEDVLCRAIEQHEAFRQEVSDAVGAVFAGYHDAPIPWVVMRRKLEPFIIAQPDPLHECLEEALARTGDDLTEHTERLRAALATRGLELVKKEPSQ